MRAMEQVLLALGSHCTVERGIPTGSVCLVPCEELARSFKRNRHGDVPNLQDSEPPGEHPRITGRCHDHIEGGLFGGVVVGGFITDKPLHEGALGRVGLRSVEDSVNQGSVTRFSFMQFDGISPI